MRYLFILLLLPVLAVASPREEASRHLNSLKKVDSPIKRLELFSQKFLGLPYGKNGPLGEGESARYDADPLYRFDTFDCTTFVETMVSLALSKDIESFEENMNRIRYANAEVGYLTRNHFPSLQWIPNNIQNGYFVELNERVLPLRSQKIAQATIDLPGWLLKLGPNTIQGRELSDEEKEIRVQELRDLAPSFTANQATLDYLAIDDLVKSPKLLDKIPNGAIVNFVRPNWDLTQAAGTHMNVSHQGFLFRKGKTLYLRHASTTGLVKEEVFSIYLKKFVGHKTLKGIHLLGLKRLR
jgi:hypothetical protein